MDIECAEKGMEIRIIMFVMGRREYIADGIFIIYFQRHAEELMQLVI